jgi:hypothetical protein
MKSCDAADDVLAAAENDVAGTADDDALAFACD